tara:strand:- start:39844 stop:40644 length:801 start_codon:yes stop_codon:yes gene_type:complete
LNKVLPKRIGTGLIYAFSLFASLFFVPNLFIFIAFILALAAVLELHHMSEKTPILIILCLSLYFGSCFFFRNNENFALSLILVFFSFFTFLLLILFSRNQQTLKFTLPLVTSISLFYISIGMSFLIFIAQNQKYEGSIMLGFVFLIQWSNDSFSYLIGKWIGKKIVFPAISPKKTLEGYIGGLICTLLFALFIGYVVDLDYFQVMTLAFLICISGNTGDLIESKIKRLLDKKDSSQLLPGHGGFFDRIDSIILSVPISYLFLYLIY